MKTFIFFISSIYSQLEKRKSETIDIIKLFPPLSA